MKRIWKYLLASVITGFVVIVPLYLSILLLIKAMKSLTGLVQPIAVLLPDWLPSVNILSLLVVLFLCLIAGLIVKTIAGQAVRQKIERTFFERIPGYALIRSLTQRLAGERGTNAWQPALAEIEEALVPAFIIEIIDNERYTVFVPSVPSPLAGAIYILERRRVHPIDVPFTQAIKVISRWGEGAKDLLEIMERNEIAKGTKRSGADV